MYLDFHSLVKSVIANVRGARRIPVWQLALAGSTALALLASLLWFAPWQVRQDGPATIPQSMPVQGSDRAAKEPEQSTPPFASPTAVSAVPSQVPEAGPAHGEQAPQSPALPPEKGEVSDAAPAQQHQTPTTSEAPAEVLDTQAMQALVTRLDTSRSIPEEHLDTKGMDNLLARLEPADKTTLPTAPRSKVARKRGTRSVPRASVGHGAPGLTSPSRSDPVPLSPVPEFQSFDTRKPVNDPLL